MCKLIGVLSLTLCLATSMPATQSGSPAAEGAKPANDQPLADAATKRDSPASLSSSSQSQPPDGETDNDASRAEVGDWDGTLTEVLAHESRIPLRASFLIVLRDWSNGEDKKVQDEIRRTLAELADTPIPRVTTKHLNEAGSIGPDLLFSSDGMPSVFRSEDFANLRSWLRAHGLLLGELPIEQQPEPRTEERWKTWFDLSAARVPRVDGKWWLVADVRPAFTRPDKAGVWRVLDHPYYLADIHVSRTQQVMTRKPGGPFLRGAAIGKTQQFSFYLPKNRVVAIDWDAPYKAAPTQAGPSDLAKVLLVIEDARMPERRSTMTVFSLPERIGSLYLADERRWLSPPDALARIDRAEHSQPPNRQPINRWKNQPISPLRTRPISTPPRRRSDTRRAFREIRAKESVSLVAGSEPP